MQTIALGGAARAASTPSLVDGLRESLRPEGTLEELVFAHLLVAVAELRRCDAAGPGSPWTDRDRAERSFFRCIRELRAIQRNRTENASKKSVRLQNEPDNSLKTRETESDEPGTPRPLPRPEPDPHRGDPVEPHVLTFRRDGPKIGRNDPCPCGGGRKYKLCCGR